MDSRAITGYADATIAALSVARFCIKKRNATKSVTTQIEQRDAKARFP
jgi:hypothetical protein